MCMLKVLIAEDNRVIAKLIEDTLVEHGYEVCGIARDVAEAVALARSHKPDLAVIDQQLVVGELDIEITAELGTLDGMGILYTTGYVSYIKLTASDGRACLAKPYRPDELLRSLEIVAEIVSTGRASPPFPRGFQVLPSATIAPREPRYE